MQDKADQNHLICHIRAIPALIHIRIPSFQKIPSAEMLRLCFSAAVRFLLEVAVLVFAKNMRKLALWFELMVCFQGYYYAIIMTIL